MYGCLQMFFVKLSEKTPKIDLYFVWDADRLHKH